MKFLIARTCALLLPCLLAGCEIGVEHPHPAATQPGAASAGSRLSGNPAEPLARGHLKFVEGFEQGCAQAADGRKPMLLFFTARWCEYCHQMADDAFTNPQVVRLSDNFVCVLVDADAEPELCRRFHVTGYPTIQFLSPRGAALGQVVGKKPGHQLMMAMQAALQGLARRTDKSDDTPPR